MAKAETLQRIREAEAQVRTLRAQAEEESERIVRGARGEALELREQMRKQAEARYEALLHGAEAEIEKQRRGILDAGAKEAAALKGKATANVGKATQLVLERFKGAADAAT